jgi:hypothetical protein
MLDQAYSLHITYEELDTIPLIDPLEFPALLFGVFPIIVLQNPSRCVRMPSLIMPFGGVYIIQVLLPPGVAHLIVLYSSFSYLLPHSIFSPILCTSPVNFAPFSHLEHAARSASTLLLYPADVLLADRVPRSHVLLHALAEALLLAAAEAGAWFWDALVEAVLVEFLGQVSTQAQLTISIDRLGQESIPRSVV